MIDPDLPLLEEVAAILDAQLKRLELEAGRSDDPDAYGVFDSLEHVAGLGFAACQNYIASWAASCRVSRQLALQLGPKHRTGQPLVALVNAAANYWKHSPEWGNTLTAQAQRTADLFASLGVPVSEYALINFLHELVRPLPSRFGTLVPFLVHWRDELAAAPPRFAPLRSPLSRKPLGSKPL